MSGWAAKIREEWWRRWRPLWRILFSITRNQKDSYMIVSDNIFKMHRCWDQDPRVHKFPRHHRAQNDKTPSIAFYGVETRFWAVMLGDSWPFVAMKSACCLSGETHERYLFSVVKNHLFPTRNTGIIESHWAVLSPDVVNNNVAKEQLFSPICQRALHHGCDALPYT